ncbi:MAG TPA: serine/threonine-protein kinase [Terracidiphilus sp.]|nr:serine/threonine-protein kinase [Terracidiphilus sp.]
MAFEAGQSIGDYEIVARLGAGGLGAVYEVRHKISQRREAMKILLPDQSGTAEMVERFRREVQTVATLNHPNIAALHNAFYYENQLVMVMELVQGETLRDRRLRTAFTLAQAMQIAAQVLHALAYAHALGVVHRDIKPSNIMITGAGEVKLLDFGIAIAGGPGELTRAGYLLGSLSYMSPEQVSGARASTRSDLYSLGVTLYELLTGQLPITGKTDYEIMMGHVHQVPTPPHQVAPAIPVPLSVAIMRALAKDPADRFPTAEAFLEAIEGVAGMLPEPTVSAAPILPAPVRASRSDEWMQPKPASSSGLQSLPLEEISRKLAVYIGPVAKIIIKRLAEKTQDPDTIYREAAKQINCDADRAAFLRSRHQ